MANEEKTAADLTGAEATEQPVVEGDVVAEDAVAASGATAEEAEPELQSIAELMSQLDVAQAEVATLKDQMLRGQADVQNVRRRAEQDVEKAHKFALEKFANEMLAIVDNLERALDAAGDDESTASLREGVEMTLNMFVGGLAKFNVEQVNPVGAAFDPALHQAMSMVPSEDAAPNTVVAVMQKGYTLHGRLLRPAMVMVAQG
ncbi:MAG: nucleotide exchange factor GrpE [Pontibacterium sp.]